MCPIDPVCGNEVGAAGRPACERAGRVFVFCCEDCRRRFLAEPERWTAAARRLPDEILRETEALIHRWFG